MADLALVILAAGESRRFGGIKQLAPYRGKPLIRWPLDACLAVPGADTAVVLGAHGDAVRPVLDADGVRVLINPDWREGMAASIRTAVRGAGGEHAGLLFLAGDQPAITAEHLQAMIESWRRHPGRIVAARYEGTLGIPALFPAGFFRELLELEGDRGARQLLGRHRDRVQAVDLPAAALDIDRPADLEAD